MASLFDPVPTVAPQTGAAPGMNIQANPNAFGANVGAAVSELGGSIEKASATGMDALTAKQHLTNEVHASEVNTWLADQITDRHTKFATLEGKAALDALPQYKSDIEGLYQQSMQQAGSLSEKAMLARTGRNLTTRYYGYATQHADSQWRTWADQTATNRAATYGAQAGIAAQNGDDKGMDVALHTSDDEVAKLYEQRGWDRDAISNAVSKNRGRNLSNIIKEQAQSDPVAAVERFRKVSEQMDPVSRLQTANFLRPQVTKLHGQEIADEILGRAPPQAQNRSERIIQKFEEAGYSHDAASAVAGHLFHESSNNPSAVHDGGIGIGIAGWNGPRRAALEKFAAGQGKPVNDFDTQVDFAISELDTGDSGAQRAGRELKSAKSIDDATAAFMHFERPQGYTPDNPRGGDSYNARLGNAVRFSQGNYNGVLPDKGESFRRIADRTQSNPQLQDAALGWANKVYGAAQVDQTKQEGAFKTRTQDSLAEAFNTGSVQQPLTRMDFMGVYGVDGGEAAYQNYSRQVQLAGDVAASATMTPQEQDDLIASRAPQPGMIGYADAVKSQERLQDAVERVRKHRSDDPAGFALQRLPGVAEARKTMTAAQSDPSLSAEDKKGAFRTYTNTLLAAQAKVGIPEDAQTPMTRNEANALADPLRNMLPGEEREVLGDLTKQLEDRYGEDADSAFAYVLQQVKLSRETSQVAARFMRKIGAGNDPPLPAPDARALETKAEIDAAQRAIGYGDQGGGRWGDDIGNEQVAPPKKPEGQNVPAGAIQYLRANPATAAQFDAMYGKGLSKTILDKYPVR